MYAQDNGKNKKNINRKYFPKNSFIAFAYNNNAPWGVCKENYLLKNSFSFLLPPPFFQYNSRRFASEEVPNSSENINSNGCLNLVDFTCPEL